VPGKIVGRTCVILLLTLTIPVTLQSREENPAVEKILQEHIEALGGEEAIASIRTIKMTAEVEIAGTGFKGTITSFWMKPCLSYTEMSLQLFEVKMGFDGETAWVMDQNGKVQIKMDDETIKSQKITCLLSNFGYILERGNLDMELARPDTVNGRPCDVIKINYRDVGTIYMSFDREKHLLRKTRNEAGMMIVESEYSDYRPVNGVLFPFKMDTYFIQMMQKIEIKYTSIEVNTPMDPAVFFPPASDVVDYRFTNDAGLSTVKMQYSNRHIFIPVTLKDAETTAGELQIKEQCMYEGEAPSEPVLFMLDSGASKSVIDSSLAVKLGLKLRDRLPGAGAGGTAYFYAVKLNGFTVGDIEFDEQTIFSFPISQLTEKFLGHSIGGILGYDFLSRFTTEINYEDSSITFYHPDTFKTINERLQRFEDSGKGQKPSRSREEKKKYCTMEAPLINNIFSFKGVIDDTCSGTFLLDTGANSSMLFKDFAEKNNLEGSKGVEVLISGAGGEERARLTRVGSIRICDYELKKPVVSISKQGKGITAFKGIDGIIGNDVLERFTVVLDYVDQKVILAGNRNFHAPFFTDKAGIIPEINSDGKIAVHAVIPHTPASKRGIKTGDVILKVNGKGIGGIEGLSVIRKAFSRREGKVVRLFIQRNGKKFHVNLRLKSYI